MRMTALLGTAIRRHPARWGVATLVVAAAGAFLLYWFAPWNLFVDRRVDEGIPGTIGAGATADAGAGPAADTGDPQAGGMDMGAGTPAAGEGEGGLAGPVTLASGELRSLEHETTGAALVLELEDGTRFLRIEDLETSNGPDLRVILTDQPLSDDWHVWDDGEVVDLGPLRGNLGSSNYEIPRNLDLAGFETAVIWCRRFSVGFAVAPLDPPA